MLLLTRSLSRQKAKKSQQARKFAQAKLGGSKYFSSVFGQPMMPDNGGTTVSNYMIRIAIRLLGDSLYPNYSQFGDKTIVLPVRAGATTRRWPE